MNAVYRMLSNAGYVITGNFLSIPLQMIAVILVVRSLGASAFGKYSFALEFSFIFSRIALGGLNILATREIARKRDQAGIYLSNLLFLFIILSTCSFVAMIVAGGLFGWTREALHILFMLGAANFLSALSALIMGVFRAYEKMLYEGAFSFVRSAFFLLTVITLVFLIRQGHHVTYMVWCLFLTHLFICAWSFYVVRHRFVKPVWRWDGTLIRFFFAETVPLALALILMCTCNRVGILVLQAKSSPYEVGIFNAAFGPSHNNLGMIAAIITGAWLPALSRSAFIKSRAYRDYARQLYRVLILAGIPLAVGSTLLASPLIRLVYGSEFAASAPVLQVLIWSTLLLFINLGSKALLESHNRQIWWTFALAVGLVVNVGLSLYLVPLKGSVGAALAMVCAGGVTTLLASFFVHRLMSWSPVLAESARTALCGLVMGVTIYLLAPISWVLAGCMGTIVYGAALLLLRLISLEELRNLGQTILRQNASMQ
jgi:O-antigen/teichoic acid export membrane protein